MNLNMNAGVEPEKIHSKSFSAKFGTKGEVWRFIATEARIYVPDYRTISIWHCKDLASGTKKAIFCDQVKVIFVPQYESVSIGSDSHSSLAVSWTHPRLWSELQVRGRLAAAPERVQEDATGLPLQRHLHQGRLGLPDLG